jgi:tRNA(His) 5'-end guanylyltransferase
MKKDDFGDRIKEYEGKTEEVDNYFSGKKYVFRGNCPLVCRIDGKCFHSFTANLRKPFDEKLKKVMNSVTKLLVEETGAKIGYTQSDEISLVFSGKYFMGGKLDKINSIIPSICTAHFNDLIRKELPIKDLAYFDCRTFIIPSICEALNYLYWREVDAIKNSVSMSAHAHFGHNKLLKMSTEDKKKLLLTKGIDWNEYREDFKSGIYYIREIVKKKFSVSELSELPEKHDARKNPDLEFERWKTFECYGLRSNRTRFTKVLLGVSSLSDCCNGSDCEL